ncbi:class I SAM-dependent methyltransferase [Portibacter marinus]|uniref:class I SAM-dependent methyltransferase n=1 Tax=Portibacter marinus TaxID=2898660 RepID=UPI001F24561F|nr:methyltransferase domain-containing protein [Portibacter marinus]
MDHIPFFLPPPIGYRKNIPLYYPKTEAEIKADSYEVYNPNVIRSTRNFYHENYGQRVLEKVRQYQTFKPDEVIVELGCGSGYLVGNLAAEFSETHFLGFDYSYQMLKMADHVFKNPSQDAVELKAFQNGMSVLQLATKNLSNLTFALSDACVTPLQDESVDFCFSCFLWDRVGQPSKLIAEKMRITKPKGRIMIISPLNYLTARGWENWYPVEKIWSYFEKIGLNVVKRSSFKLTELLDIRRNRVEWEIECMVLQKVDNALDDK